MIHADNYLNRLPSYSKEQIYDLAIDLAIKAMIERGGPQVGEVAIHKSLNLVYMLQKIEGEIAFLIIPARLSPTHEDIVKQFPADEIYNPNDLVKIFAQLQEQADIIVESN